MALKDDLRANTAGGEYRPKAEYEEGGFSSHPGHGDAHRTARETEGLDSVKLSAGQVAPGGRESTRKLG